MSLSKDDITTLLQFSYPSEYTTQTPPKKTPCGDIDISAISTEGLKKGIKDKPFDTFQKWFADDYWYKHNKYPNTIRAFKELDKYFLVKNVSGDGNCLLRSINQIVANFKMDDFCKAIPSIIEKLKGTNSRLSNSAITIGATMFDTEKGDKDMTSKNIINYLNTDRDTLSAIYLDLLAVFLNSNIYVFTFMDNTPITCYSKILEHPPVFKNVYLLNFQGHYSPLVNYKELPKKFCEKFRDDFKNYISKKD